MTIFLTTDRAMPPPAARLADVTRTYPSPSGEVHALRAVTHAFERTTFTAVMGPSGSGKTSLLQVAAGLDRPTSGDVAVGPVWLGALSESQRTVVRRTSTAFVFQDYNLLDALTVADNVALPARLAGRKVARAEVAAVLERVGLPGVGPRRPSQLSGGQQQRVALARAMHVAPTVLFADEPTGALDRASGRVVLDLLRRMVDEDGQTVVMVTHDPLAASYAHETLFLADGRIVGRMPSADATQIAARMNELEP